MKKVEEIILTKEARTIEEAFSLIAEEMFAITIETEKLNEKLNKTIMIRSKDLKSLLYLYLKKLYDLANNELFILKKIKDLKIETISDVYLLTAVASGDKFNQDYKIKDIIKQITDRNLSVKEYKNSASVQINIIVERREDEN